MITVLILFSSSEIGGAERSLSRMALDPGASDIQYKFATLGSESGAWVTWLRDQGQDPIVLGPDSRCRKFAYYSFASRKFISAWRQIQPDVIYVVGLKAALLARLLKPLMPSTKIIHAIRTNLPEGSILARNFTISERLLSPCTDGYITNSKVAACRLTEIANVPPQKITVIYNGLDTGTASETASDKVQNEICVVANINQYKGHLQFLDVVSRVCAEIPNVHFTFVGRDDLGGRLQQEITARGLSTVITLAGYQDQPAPFLQRASIFVLPSLTTEGTPTSILEAFSFGLPVVAYKIGGIPELVANDQDGFLIEPGNAGKMADALIKMIKNPELAVTMGRSGQQKITTHFTLSASADKHNDYWHSLLQEAK
ncbi:glycosyltransferase family 4 protein [Govanella unica]|uniref:Glycosyltransferase family 4 protein n=1 Tax=Govanella unica TaxID=2975056 RepID=A0A9X3TUM3_9PROT|nr:glycosyltransferase family 4 protein [Govania unica]MDA5192500.1 glycosyltransferase family 4 protein [Govania unica]